MQENKYVYMLLFLAQQPCQCLGYRTIKKKKKVSLTAERVTTYDFAASDDFIWKCTNYYFSGFGHCNRPTFSKELGPNGVRSASFSFYFIVKSPFWLVNSVGLSNYDLKSTDIVIILSFCDGYDISSYNFQLPSKTLVVSNVMRGEYRNFQFKPGALLIWEFAAAFSIKPGNVLGKTKFSYFKF